MVTVQSAGLFLQMNGGRGDESSRKHGLARLGCMGIGQKVLNKYQQNSPRIEHLVRKVVQDDHGEHLYSLIN